jgi:glycosyltransferase involved in cell wall biosynthesis
MNHETIQMPETAEPTRTPWSSRVGLVIPTLNAGNHLDRLLPALRSQTLVPARFLVIDSSSRDETVARFRAAGAEVRLIAPESFDHGATRQMAVDVLDDVEFIIFLTQDAIPAHPEAFAKLIAPFRDSDVGATYGRQLPSPEAGPIGAHARLFNYPERSHVRTMADAPRIGIKTIFCSNSFAAYRRAALIEAGGFPEGTIFGEDMLVAASLLQRGRRVCYAAEAKVYHSHDYGLAEEFRRYFDIGVLHDTQSELLRPFNRMGGEGLRFLGSELSYLRTRAVNVIPLALLRTLLKYGGYRLGRVAQYLPVALNRRLSMNRRYWMNRTSRLAISDAKQTTAKKAQTGR